MTEQLDTIHTRPGGAYVNNAARLPLYSIKENDTMDNVKLRTQHFGARTRMSRQAFEARIRRAGEDVATVTVESDGRCQYIEVLKNGVHVARYLLRQGVLWYETPEHHARWLAAWERVKAQYHPLPVDSWDGDGELAGEYDAWPPRCPECGLGKMEVKFNRFGQPFWSCRLFKRRLCQGSRGFTLHPDEQREHEDWRPWPQGPPAEWGAKAIMNYERTARRAHYKLLVVQSLERLGYDAHGGRLP